MKDIIVDVLDTVRFKSAVYFKHGFCGNWGMGIPAGDYAQFHFVSGGTCILEIDEKVYEMTKGDLVIFPKGQPHRIKANRSATCQSGQSVVMGILDDNDPFQGMGDISTNLICGHYELDRTVNHFILSELPEFILIKSDDYGRFDLIDNVLNHIIEEFSNERIGYKTIIIRFAEILFVSILRHYYLNQCDAKINLFNDEEIYKSVNYIHNNLNSNLNIENLSRYSGISRTLFIERFKKSVGNTPLAYIKDWRMTKAKQLLTSSNFSLGEIGEQVGYSTASTLTGFLKNHIIYLLINLEIRTKRSNSFFFVMTTNVWPN